LLAFSDRSRTGGVPFEIVDSDEASRCREFPSSSSPSGGLGHDELTLELTDSIVRRETPLREAVSSEEVVPIPNWAETRLDVERRALVAAEGGEEEEEDTEVMEKDEAGGGRSMMGDGTPLIRMDLDEESRAMETRTRRS
jgi:hypothetical protein